MHCIGIGSHKLALAVAVKGQNGPVGRPRRIRCKHESEILAFFERLRPFTPVVEGPLSYR